MKSSIRVLPRVFKDGQSVCHAEVEILPTRGNADLLRLIARRAVRLNEVRKAASASTIAADDFAAGAFAVRRDGITTHWLLRSVTFDCAGGRAPCMTVSFRHNVTVQLNPSGDLNLEALSSESTLPVSADTGECSCSLCGFTNHKAALDHPGSRFCVDCGTDPLRQESAGLAQEPA